MCSINFGLTPARQRSSPAKGILLDQAPSVAQIFGSDISNYSSQSKKKSQLEEKKSLGGMNSFIKAKYNGLLSYLV